MSIGWAYAICKEHGVDTSGMTPKQVIEKANELRRSDAPHYSTDPNMGDWREQSRQEWQKEQEQRQYKTLTDSYDCNEVFAQEEEYFYNRISVEQYTVLREYTSFQSFVVNEYLRDPNSFQFKNDLQKIRLPQSIRLIDRALKEFDLKENIKLYRALSEKDVLAMSNVKSIQDLKPGTKLKDGGYMSTTPLQSAVYEYCEKTKSEFVLEMNINKGVGKGAYINKLSPYENVEFEFLLPRGKEFVIMDIKSKNGKTYIELEEL